MTLYHAVCLLFLSFIPVSSLHVTVSGNFHLLKILAALHKSVAELEV